MLIMVGSYCQNSIVPVAAGIEFLNSKKKKKNIHVK